MRRFTRSGSVIGPSAALSSALSSCRTCSSVNSKRCAKSAFASLMMAGFPLNAAYAFPAASLAASLTGFTSVAAAHWASLLTR